MKTSHKPTVENAKVFSTQNLKEIEARIKAAIHYNDAANVIKKEIMLRLAKI